MYCTAWEEDNDDNDIVPIIYLLIIIHRYKYVYYTAGEEDDLEIEGEKNSGYEAESSEARSENTKMEGE